MKTILALNFGSSSIKFAVFHGKERILHGLVQNTNALEKQYLDIEFNDTVIHENLTGMALDQVILKLIDILHANDIYPDGVGHRILHGGEDFSASCIVTEEVKNAIRKYYSLAPLHNPVQLHGIEVCEAVMPTIPQVAVFDTAFHQTMPPKAFMYGLPYEYYTDMGIRRFGFHGNSHKYVSRHVCDFLNIDPVGTKIIVCHLGNGSSLSAVVDGRCVDTSMGLSPVEGLLMGTRSGSIDPTVVQYIANKSGMTPDQVLAMLNNHSGLLGIVGEGTSDMRDIERLADEGHERAILALDMLYYQLKKLIGSFIVAMNGVDIICFTGGIGQNSHKLRSAVMTEFDWLGVEIDENANRCKGTDMVISTPKSTIRVCVIPTNEELMIALDTAELLDNN